MMKIKFSLILFFFVTQFSFALEVDEKLTLRLLSVSNTKKTVLINRGLEDGLVVGDHAKFFLTFGVVARAVVIKASPTRTIWSIYRTINPESIIKDKVMNLKISTPVKLTEDPSRSLKEEQEFKEGEKLNIALGDNANDLPTGLSQEERGDLAALEGGESVEDIPVVSSGGLGGHRNLEIWGLLHFTTLSGTFDDGGTDTTGDASASSVEFSLGGEYYFSKFNNFLRDFSVTGFLAKRTVSVGATNTVSNDWFEFGGGINWHFYNPPMSYQRLIGFLGTSFGVGSVTTELPVGTNIETANGNNNFFSLGVGGKYYLANGFGMRVLTDFFRSGESFTFDDDSERTRTLSGLRAQVGLSYRW